MPCKKFCYYRKTRLTEDSEYLTLALEIFTRAYRLLKNFMDLYKIHEGKCCGMNYDAVPLHGALDIVATAMTAIVCGNVKKGSQRSALFRNMFPCVHCQDMEVLPEEIVRKLFGFLKKRTLRETPRTKRKYACYLKTRSKPEEPHVDIIVTCLERCCAIENITCRIKDVLCILERSAPCAMSEKFQTLSLLLKEIMRKLIRCGQDLEEPFGNTQTRLILNLVNNFIRDWSEKRSGSRPCLRICRFCDRVVNETTRQWDAGKDEAIDRRPKSKSSRNERFDDDSRTYASVGMSRAVDVTDYDDSSARFDERTSVKEKLESPDRTIKHRSAGEISETRRAEAEVFSKKTKIERYDDSSRKWDKFDRVEGRDLTKTAAGTSSEGKMRGKIKRNRDIDRIGEYPITPDGREERDDVPYKSKLDKIRGSRGLRDTNEERAAAGKMKKIKRDAKYLSQKRLEYTEFSETESEGTGVHRSREGDKGVPVITEKSPKERRKNKLHGHTLPENEGKKMVEKTTDTDIEEKTTGRRNRKKPRTEEDIELDEMTDTGERKEADRRKKKKADGFDSGKKVVSYTFDKEDKVLKSGGTQDGRSSNERNETESILTKKHRDIKHGVSSAEDKSTLDSGSQNKKETSKSSKKEHRRSGSDRTEDNSSKTNGSRYRKKRAIFSDIQIGTLNVQKARDIYGYKMYDRSPIEYQLSNQHFVKLGWTVLPVAKTMRKIIQYRAKPSKPGLDWFRKHRLDGRTYYDDEARIFVNFHTDGSAEVFYPNGAMAIKLQRPQNRKYDIYTVFSPGGKDCMGVKRDSQIVAVFDTVGNGAVFNEDGATRLSYNQIGGIWRDNPTGVPLTWKWDICEKKSITKIVYLEKSAIRIEKLLNLAERRILKSSASVKASTSPASPRNKEKKVEELKPVVPEHDDEEEEVESGEIRPDDTYHFRPIHLNVNDYIGLKIVNRTNIILRFLADKKSIRIQLGTILNLNEEVESYFVDTSLKHGMLKCKFEELLPSRLKLDSCMNDIAEKIQKVRRSARYRELMMAKYRPLLRVWKMSGTRCRPR